MSPDRYLLHYVSGDVSDEGALVLLSTGLDLVADVIFHDLVLLGNVALFLIGLILQAFEPSHPPIVVCLGTRRKCYIVGEGFDLEHVWPPSESRDFLRLSALIVNLSRPVVLYNLRVNRREEI